MKVRSAQVKVVLYDLFYDKVEAGIVPTQIPIEHLEDAASVAKKIMKGHVVDEEDGSITFSKDVVTLTPSEAAVMKTLFDKRVSWSVNMADGVLELRELFKREDSND